MPSSLESIIFIRMIIANFPYPKRPQMYFRNAGTIDQNKGINIADSSLLQAVFD